MNEIFHIYKRPDINQVFVWHGGAYIEVYRNLGDVALLGAYPYDVINVWNYQDDEPYIHLEQESPYDGLDFEAACVDWLVEQDILPFFCRVDEIDVDDLIDLEVSV